MNINIMFSFFVLMIFVACEETVFFPTKGKVEGTVRDNNDEFLSGVSVSANFMKPSTIAGEANPTTLTGTTSDEGEYTISELWDQVELSVDHSGFKPTFQRVDLNNNSRPIVDFKLIGSPTIENIKLSQTVLSIANMDTITVRVEVLDEFNSISTGYTSNMIFKNMQGGSSTIAIDSINSQSFNNYTFTAIVTSDLLTVGTYRVIAEVRDPDGNTHLLEATEFLKVE